MPSTAQLDNAPRCQHVHYSGRPCKAPARRGRNYCIFHQAAHLDSGGCVLPIVEDLHSYQLAVIRIARALADDAIDSRKATALLYALQLAGWKLADFAAERRDIEDPDDAFARRVSAHFLARHMKVKFPVPTDQELTDIIQEIRVDPPAEPTDDIAILPQPPLAPDEPTAEMPEAGSPKPPHAGCPTLTDVGRVGTPNSGPPTSPDPLKGPSLAEILLDRLKLIESEDANSPGGHIPIADAPDPSQPSEAP